MLERSIQDLDDLRNVLQAIDFAASCIDMGWKWEAELLYIRSKSPNATTRDFEFAGYRFRTTFQRPDRETKIINPGFGRWWEVPEECSTGSVVKTAYLACHQILVHELMEAFHYSGLRIFDPHHELDDLAAAVHHNDNVTIWRKR